MFITIEGPEGSGKTTAVNAAVKKLEELGIEEGDTVYLGDLEFDYYR